MKKLLLICLFWIPYFLFSQKIFGTITDASSRPLEDVKVYIDGTKLNTKTNSKGEFLLELGSFKNGNVAFYKENYALQVHPIQELISKKANVILEKETQIQEVSLIPFSDKNFEENYQRFCTYFLGDTDLVKIVNKRDLLFANVRKDQSFYAKAKKTLRIENQYLGYIIEYQLVEFLQQKNQLLYLGTSFFTEMKGSKSKMKKWEENRKSAYFGSSLHFFRSVYQGKVKENHFNVNHAKKIKNPNYPTETELNEAKSFVENHFKNNKEKPLVLPEKLKIISEKMSRNSPELLAIYKTTIPETDYTHKKGEELWLQFEDLLQVVYSGNGKIRSTLLDAASHEFLINKEGTYSDPELLILNGDWGKDKINTLLPLDYEP